MNSKEENLPLRENYVDENGVLIVIAGGIIPGSDVIDPETPMILTSKMLDFIKVNAI